MKFHYVLLEFLCKIIYVVDTNIAQAKLCFFANVKRRSTQVEPHHMEIVFGGTHSNTTPRTEQQQQSLVCYVGDQVVDKYLFNNLTFVSLIFSVKTIFLLAELLQSRFDALQITAEDSIKNSFNGCQTGYVRFVSFGPFTFRLELKP